MLSLGQTIGRQAAHEVVHHAARSVATGETRQSFAAVLAADPRIRSHLSPEAIATLLDPAQHTGLSAEIAQATAARARDAAKTHRPA